MAKDANADVEAVARWIHAAWLKVRPEYASCSRWGDLSTRSARTYRGVARLLLAEPPPAVRRAVKKLEART
jgi:hypothetical protein